MSDGNFMPVMSREFGSLPGIGMARAAATFLIKVTTRSTVSGTVELEDGVPRKSDKLI